MRIFICINKKLNELSIDDNGEGCIDKCENRPYLLYYDYIINHEFFHIIRSITMWILIMCLLTYD